VVVEVDQSRQDDAPRAVEDFVRGGIHASDRHDPAFLDSDVSGQPPALRVLSDNRAAAEEEGGRASSMDPSVERFCGLEEICARATNL
jgi:hypothetical protein